MRTVLAAAAAGALVLGSAGGAIADPGKAKGPKASASKPTMTKLQTVNIKRHKKIDLADLPESVNLRAKVRNANKVLWSEALPQEFGVYVGVYTKKVNGTEVAGTKSDVASTVKITEKKKPRKSHKYTGTAVLASVWTEPSQLDALKAHVTEFGKAYICLKGVDDSFEFTKYSQQTRMRLGTKADGSDITKKTVRDCVKVVNSATDSTSDGEQES